MKTLKLFGLVSALSLSTVWSVSHSATLSIDLDPDTPGIQSSRTLTLGNEYGFDVVFIGDGTTQFDTFAMDVLYRSDHTQFMSLDNPVAGSVVADVPIMALDIHSATSVSNGDTLATGNSQLPLGYDGNLGVVGISS
jgi:hypothetical protein